MIPRGNSKRTATAKAGTIVVRGGAGLSRRQAASIRSGGEQFPPLPKRPTLSLVTRVPSDRAVLRKFTDAVQPRLNEAMRGKASNPYLNMVINPFEAEGHRYPDDTIVPTAMVKLARSSTFTVDSTGSASGFMSVLGWKVRDYAAGPPAAYTIMLPSNIGTYSLGDYGSPQSAWRAVDYTDRTLALAVRVRVMGLPTSSFLPSGTLYFLQYQPGEIFGSFDTEAECVNAVTARKGFSITLAEIGKLGQIHCPYLPQGPMSYVFSGSNASGADGSVAAQPSTTVVSPNGGIIVVGYGLQTGTVLRFDYAHHVEYIPGQSSAGLIETRVQLPSVADREYISHGAQSVMQSIAGGTSAMDLAPIVVPHVIRGGGVGTSAPFGSSVSSASSTVGSIVDTLSGATTAATALARMFGY